MDLEPRFEANKKPTIAIVSTPNTSSKTPFLPMPDWRGIGARIVSESPLIGTASDSAPGVAVPSGMGLSFRDEDGVGVGVGLGMLMTGSERGRTGGSIVLTLVRSSALVRSMTVATSASVGRPFGSLESIRNTRSSSSAGTSATDDGRGGASIRCFATISIALSASNGGRPVSSSNRMPPTA